MSAVTPSTSDFNGEGLEVISPSPSGAGTGNAIGASSSTDNSIVRFDGVTGKSLQNSGVGVDDNNNLVFPTTANSSATGIIYKGSALFLHNYQRTSTTGQNSFLGLNCGNVSMTGTSGSESSNNCGFGYSSLLSLTTGSGNCAFGVNAGTLITTGSENFCFGNSSGSKITTGSSSSYLGSLSGQFNTGNNNTGIGSAALKGVNGSSTGGRNASLGTNSLTALTTGTDNFAGGYTALDAVTTGSRNIGIGLVDTSGATVSDEMNIGNLLYGKIHSASVKGVGINITPPNITSWLHLPAGTTAASTSPLKFTSGPLNTTAEAGAMEFLTDTLYLTQTTGASRRQILFNTSNSYSQVGTATTVFTVTIGYTQANTTYKVSVSPTNALSAALFYITNKTTTTFDVTYLAGLTGTVAFDWSLFP